MERIAKYNAAEEFNVFANIVENQVVYLYENDSEIREYIDKMSKEQYEGLIAGLVDEVFDGELFEHLDDSVKLCLNTRMILSER